MIHHFGITHCSMVPTQLLRLLEAGEEHASLKAILVGGSPVSAELVRRAWAAGLPIHTTYGLTETASQVTTTASSDGLSRLFTSGALLPYRKLKIAPDGEILVAGKTLFEGYLDGDRIDRAVDDEGWFHTRDVGEIDSRGCLRVKGRIDNMFVCGGENIHPEVIEQALAGIKGVRIAVVVPQEDREFGQVPLACIQLEPAPGKMVELDRFDRRENQKRLDQLVSSYEFQGKLAMSLPRFMIPKHFRLLPETIATELFKIDRKELARLLRNE